MMPPFWWPRQGEGMEFEKRYQSLLREYLETEEEGILLKLSNFAAKECIENQIAPDVITDLHNHVVRDKLDGSSPESIKRIILQGDEALLEVMSRYSSVFFEYLAQIEAEKEKEKALSKEIKRTSKKLEHLHKVADSLADCNSEQEVYRITIETAEAILDFPLCILYAAEDDKLVVKGTSSKLSPDIVKEMKLDEEGLTARTYRTGETVPFDTMKEVVEADPGGQSLHSGISLPIEEIGVLQVASTSENAFSQDDVRLLELLAEHAAGAVQRIRLENELVEQAIRDPLTNLHNRRYFNEIIGKEMERSKREHHPLAFLLIDVNRFKEINDRYSHLIGDEVLKEVASILKESTRDADTVVRYGGDEFLILVTEKNEAVEEIETRLKEKFVNWNQENDLLDFPLTLAMGTSFWSPADERGVEEVLKEADKIMYENKGKSLK